MVTVPEDPLRVLLAHPKSWDDFAIDTAVAKLQGLYVQGMAAKATREGTPVRGVNVTSGRDDFKNRAKVVGGGKVWGPSIAGNRVDGKPRFHRVVCPTLVVGRGTADILAACLAAKRDVLYWDGNAVIKRVKSVFGSDPYNWQTGWELVL